MSIFIDETLRNANASFLYVTSSAGCLNIIVGFRANSSMALNCLESATFEVDFIATDDPCFYDKADRCRLEVKLEEDVEYDDAVRPGARR